VHPTAGATVVGAAQVSLIAYNVFLNTPDVDIAKKVAKGGAVFPTVEMRFVKGAGFLVRGAGSGFNESY